MARIKKTPTDRRAIYTKRIHETLTRLDNTIVHSKLPFYAPAKIRSRLELALYNTVDDLQIGSRQTRCIEILDEILRQLHLLIQNILTDPHENDATLMAILGLADESSISEELSTSEPSSSDTSLKRERGNDGIFVGQRPSLVLPFKKRKLHR